MNRETLFKIFSEPPVLETARLKLRAMRATDAEDMFEYAKEPEVTRYLLWRAHETQGYTRDYLRYVESRYAVGDFYDFAIVEREGGKMIGTCGFTRIDTVNNVGEIGYVLNPSYAGRGYATEAAREMMRYGFEELGLHRIEARYMKGNEASVRVMEKLGMSFEGYSADSMYVKGEYKTIGTYAILEKDHRRINNYHHTL
jgi:ribosomal-protein-alanine N-acetyltransferase